MSKLLQLYPIHLTLCSDITRKRSERTKIIARVVLLHAIKVEYRLACLNTAPIIDLRAYVTAKT